MRYDINPDIVWADTDDEVRLYDPATGGFETLNKTGSEIWRLVAEGSGTEHVADVLANRYAHGEPGLSTAIGIDIARFLQTLVDRGLLRRTVEHSVSHG